MRFWGYFLTQKQEYGEAHSISIVKNGFFGLQNCLLRVQGKKTFLSTLNVMILQTVRNECVRFGGHVDIEVSYKILRLEVLKETPSLQNPPCFE
jgi:hypothetical protein